MDAFAERSDGTVEPYATAQRYPLQCRHIEPLEQTREAIFEHVADGMT